MKAIFNIGKTHAILLIAVIHVIGLLGLNLESTAAVFEFLTPLNLLFSSLLIFSFHKGFDTKFWIFCILVASVGFLVELAGVHTGVIFGEYWYLHVLGPKLAGVPIMIAVNWLMLLYCC